LLIGAQVTFGELRTKTGVVGGTTNWSAGQDLRP